MAKNALKDFTKDVNTAPPDELGHFHHHFSITMELEHHPMMMAMTAIAVILIVLFVLRHGVQQSATSQNNTIPVQQPDLVNTILSTGQSIPVDVTNPPNQPIPVQPTPGPPPVPVTCKTGFHFVPHTSGIAILQPNDGRYGVSGGWCVPDNPITPIPVPPPLPVPPPPTPNPPPVPQVRTQVVGHWPNWDGSLFGIAQHWYGNGSEWPKIYQANRNLIGPNPSLIRAGMVLIIP